MLLCLEPSKLKFNDEQNGSSRMTSTFKACMKKFALDMYYKASFLVFAGLTATAWCNILVENILAKK